MALMGCCGANAGALSPFAPTGIIANGLIGLQQTQWINYVSVLAAQSLVGFAGYFVLGGMQLLARGRTKVVLEMDKAVPEQGFTTQQKITLRVIVALIASVLLFKIDVTIGAFVGAVMLALLRAADEREALRAMPWSVVLMVCGVTVLIGVADRLGGTDLLTSLLSKFSTPNRLRQ